jgi:heat shock protein HslJ
MNNHIAKILISSVVLILLACGVWYGINRSVSKSDKPNQQQTDMVYIDSNQMRLRSVFSLENNLVTIYFEEFQGIELAQVEAASGAQYRNDDLKLMLWNKGDEVFLYQNEEVIFTNSSAPNTSGSATSTNSNISDLEKIKKYIWVWQETQLNDGSVITPNTSDVFSVTFDNEGNVSGATDCNGFGGTYKLDKQMIEFGPFIQTLMYCEGSQEQEFVRMISDSTSYTFDQEDNLILLIKYDSGSVLFKKGKSL